MAEPWLSVVMPTYNGERYLGWALGSIAAQADRGIEVVLVDDGSSDRTLSIARSFSGRLQMRIIEQEHRGSWVASTNRGLAEARADYVSLLHQDDEWAPRRGEVIARWLGGLPGQSLLIHAARFIDARGRPLGLWRCPLSPCTVLRGTDLIPPLLIQNFICIAATAFPRQLALDVGGLDETLWYTADWDLWLRLGQVVEAVGYLDTPLVSFRIHPSSITSTRSGHIDDFRWQLEAVLERHLPRWDGVGVHRRRVEAAARFSVEVNIALAALAHRKPMPLARLGRAFFRLGPRGLGVFLRDSRIAERFMARVRARMPLRAPWPSQTR